MGIHYIDLEIAQRIRDRQEESLDHLAKHFERSISSIRRSISALNDYLPADYQIISDDSMVSLQMPYSEYIKFVQSLTMDDYILEPNERIDLIILHMFFCPYLNMSALYESLHFSMATRKIDSTAMKHRLDEMSLSLERVPRKGVRIAGDELKFRIYICQILSRLFDIEPDGSLKPRKANTSFQLLCVRYLFQYAGDKIPEASEMIRQLQDSSHIRLAYNSAKLLYAYTVCTLFRISNSHSLIIAEKLPALVTDRHFFTNEFENMTYNCLIASLETLNHVIPPAEEKLALITFDLIGTVQKQILTWISDDSHLYEDVYSALHRFLFQQYFGFKDPDFMLDEINVRYHYLYEVLGNALQRYQVTYGVRITHAQLSTLTMIFRKYVNRDKLMGRNTKKIVIISSSSLDRIEYFVEKLKIRVDVRLITVISISELYLLKQIKYDALIVFSKRIQNALKEEGYNSLLLHFYPEDADFSLLFSNGFSTSRRKVKADQFLRELSQQPESDRRQFLLEQYDDYFIE